MLIRSEKEQSWRWVLDEQAGSGLPIRALCQQEGASEPSFYSWHRTIAQRDAAGTPSTAGQPTPEEILFGSSTPDKILPGSPTLEESPEGRQ